ncbi:hypothetical protein [Pseudomonas chlororaphis]|uniref:hypothetical protein n=2 Tax=Pseudomonas chlororaphis TaxID=587753 RepID=UPI00055AA1EA|nr:hypothetical protein [Pseudomonas chlororaphis]AZE05881.1 hypothetical protein C4K11_3722 [Pseudomonas chlororaphis subsp. aureofaciens]AZE12078.1 hypothetical protein C4K10_3801 [Pseudomonas chlororaphis subsp. aureofaciens]WDG45992.1 hypothetical protein PUP58_19785 [Pseudomonas chlororaphis]
MKTLPNGRLLEHFGELTAAERILLEHAASGSLARIADSRPETGTKENKVRARFLRFLILGGDAENPVHERGINLRGAYIVGVLDLRGAEINISVTLEHCLCFQPLYLEDMQLKGSLNLNFSAVPGLVASRASISGSLYLNKVYSHGTIQLIAAKIGGSIYIRDSYLYGLGEPALLMGGISVGSVIRVEDKSKVIGGFSLVGALIDNQLSCSNCKFIAIKGPAFNADNILVKGGVYLTKGFHSVGLVRISGARIAGQLSLRGAHFQENGENCLSAQGMQVGSSLIMTDFPSPLRMAAFNGSHVKSLTDDEKTWGNELSLNGFIYNFINSRIPLTAETRIAWLNSQNPANSGNDGLKGSNSEFRPQPWRHLQKVFEEMGHSEEARKVGIAFEKRLRKVGLVGQGTARWWPGFRWLGLIPHVLYGALTGYGYRPMRLLAWILGIWLFFTTVYWYAAVEQNVFAPSNPLVFQNDAYTTCRKEYGEGWQKRSPDTPIPSGIGNWYTCDALRGEYTGFSPGAYSLDILLSLVDLQQEKDWGPITTTPSPNAWLEFWNWDWGHSVRFLVWLETLIGWGISLLLVAIVSGLTRRKE